MSKKKLTQKRLKELLHYDPDTGVFTRKIATGGNGCYKVGSPTGFRDSRGYFNVYVDRKRHYAHRLAWLYTYGYTPENGLDHINRNTSDNNIKNLREVSQTCNVRNTGNRKNNRSGVKGVGERSDCNRWVAEIRVNHKQIYLGLFKEFSEAVCTRLAAEQCLDWDGCDSSSPAYKYVQDMLK